VVTFNISAGGTYTMQTPAQFTATADGDALVIVNRAGTSFTPAFTITPSGQGAVDSTAPISALAQLRGTPVLGDTWYALLTINGQIFSYSHTVTSVGGLTETLADISTSLAVALNAAAPAQFVTTAEGDNLIVISADGQAFALGYEISRPNGTSLGVAVRSTTKVNSVVASLSGTPTEGEIWSVVLTIGTEHMTVSYTVTSPLETLADIANGLASAINEVALGEFLARGNGDKIVIVSLDGAAFTAAPEITPARPLVGAGAVSSLTNVTKIADLGGTPRVDSIWNVLLTIGGFTRTFSYTVGAGQDLADIASGFAAALNNQADAGIVATTEGVSLIVTDRFGRPFQLAVQSSAPQFSAIDDSVTGSTTVQLSGIPAPGETWTLTIDDRFYSVLISGVPETLAQVAALFASAINADAAAGNFSAWADGDLLVIVNRVGAVFATTLVAQGVTRSVGGAFTTLDFTLTAAELQEKLRTLYGFDGVLVQEQRGIGNVLYTVTFVGDQGGVDLDEINWGEDRDDTGLIPSANASADVIVRTIRDGSYDPELNNAQTVTINDAVGGTFRLSFVLENEDGELVEVWTEPVPYNATALDLFKALSRVLNPNGATIDIDPEFDRVTRIPSRPFTDNVSVSKHDKVFHIAFQGVYEDLAIHNIDTTQLLGAARGTTVTFSGVTDGSASVETGAGTTTTIALGGTPAADDVWSVGLTFAGNTTEFQHAVASGESLTEIAIALAAEINARGGAGFVATSRGGTLVIVNLTGKTFITAFSVVGAGSGVLANTASTTVLTLNGAALVNELWSVTIDDVTVNHTVASVDADGDPETPQTRPQTTAEIAAALSAVINATVELNAFVAAVNGNSILITRLEGTAFTTTVQVTAAGLPVAGDVWMLTLSSGMATQYGYTVQVGDTAADVAQGLADQINLIGLPEYAARTEGHVLIIDDVAGNTFNVTYALVPAIGSTATAVTEHATASVATRVNGINYYGIKMLNLTLGSGDDVINVQGTSAITNLNLGDGDERIYVSSTANFDFNTTTDFLRGHLHDLDGTLNIDAGAGRHLLLISDESSMIDDDDVLITDTFATAAARPEAHPSMTGEALLNAEIYIFDLATGAITFKADAGANFAEGITIWSGFGDDTMRIDGTHYRNQFDDNGSVIRTVTSLNTGLGNDRITIDLDAGEDDFFVLHTQGPYDSFLEWTDDDIVIGASTEAGDVFDSTLPLMVFGGQGNDTITTGSANDIVLGDRGNVWLNDASGVPVGLFGKGGHGDLYDGVAHDVSRIFSVDPAVGGNDSITTNSGVDLVIGGLANDLITLGNEDDSALGDNGYFRFDVDLDFTTLDLMVITEPNLGGDDTISGGSDEDRIFGGTGADTISGGDGHDVILGDHGRLDYSLPANQNFVSIFTGATDGAGNDVLRGDAGDDFILGQQGDDRIFGGAGEDDLTGGHNVVAGVDGHDYIDGGDEADDTVGDDADVILGDNGLITRTPLPGYPSSWQLYPTPFLDVIRTVVRFDDIDLITGDDTILGDGGDDILHGQRGSDNIDAGAGEDEVYGELGEDVLSGGSGADFMIGDVGVLVRAFNPDGTPTVNDNGSWHRDVFLEEVGVITGMIHMDTTPLRDMDVELARQMLLADLVILGGSLLPGGGKLTNYDTGAWATDILLIDLMPTSDDVLNGGDGEDILFGQRGSDTLNGGGENDLIFGDGATNVLPFQTNLPQIVNGLRLISIAPGSGVPLILKTGGSVIVPNITMR
ncbi:MAG TPA: calcium-binding protein, partial [Candidatus Acidoferrum sp.]|nr:calcium-binding protein [Candidatus Acidoferrum sp.]